MAVCSLCFTSCLSDLDNYESPNGGIKGQILDAETNEPIPLPVQGSTGVIINMFEQNTDATQSVDFYAKMRSCSTVIIKLWLTARLFLLAKNL